MCKINLNQELNGIELSFENKPEQSVIDSMKAQGFKWNRRTRVWYAKQTATRMEFAKTLGSFDMQTADLIQKEAATTLINLERLGSNRPEYLGGAELSKAIREDLKRRGVRGCSVKVDHYHSITVTYKASAADFASVEEAKKRYHKVDIFRGCGRSIYYDEGQAWINEADFEKMTEEEQDTIYTNLVKQGIKKVNSFSLRYYYTDRDYYWELSGVGFEKLRAIYLIANQWNYDHSDLMTDYHDVGYYLDIDIKHPEGFEVREEMTEAERIEYQAEQEKKEAEEAAQLAKLEQERKEAEEESRRYNEWVKQAETTIYNDIQVEDLPEADHIYITNLLGGYGKDSTLAELEEAIQDREEDGRTSEKEGVITRLITFNSPEAFEDFNKLYLHDFIFVAGKGGTASEDSRLDNPDIYNRLSAEQRESIKWYMSDCIGVIFDNKLQLVIDPEGYNYSRYVYKVSEDSEIKDAKTEIAKQRAESEGKEFYIPEAVGVQIENIKPGMTITVFKCDGWFLNNIYAGSGEVLKVEPGTWAQYSGYYISFTNNKRVFIRNGNECLIYEGLQVLPHHITHRRISDTLEEVLTVFDGLFKRVYDYLIENGKQPLVNTCYMTF